VIEETGVVVAVHGDLAEIESRRQSACGSCAANGGCGTSLLERHFGRRPLVLTVYNQIGASPGESVVIGVPEQSLLMLSLAAYVVPLVTMIAGAIAGSLFASIAAPGSDRELSLAAGVIGLAVGLGWLGRFSRARESDARYRPVVLRRSASGGVDVGIPGQPTET